MTAIDHYGFKVPLPRRGADEFWRLMQDRYAGEDERKWRYLAMLALKENAGWTLELIGKAFGHPKGHVHRCLKQVKEEVRARFAVEPELRNAAADEFWDTDPFQPDALHAGESRNWELEK